MKTITIQTKADKSVIEAIKTLILATDKEATIISDENLETYNDDYKEHRSLDQIRAEVKDAIEQIEKGTMRLYTSKEIRTYTDSIING